MHTDLPDFSMPSDEQVNLAAESFRLLADVTRVKLLWALLQGESSVTCLAELVGTSPTAVSQHLAKLRLARLVKARRDGTFVFYSAADVHVRRLLDEALFHADHADQDLPDHPDGGSPQRRQIQEPGNREAISGAVRARWRRQDMSWGACGRDVPWSVAPGTTVGW